MKQALLRTLRSDPSTSILTLNRFLYICKQGQNSPSHFNIKHKIEYEGTVQFALLYKDKKEMIAVSHD